MKKNLLNSLSKSALCLLLALVTGGTTKAADVLYKTALFGQNYNSQTVGNYTSTWSATNGNFTVSLANFNNGMLFDILGYQLILDRWSYVACGSNSPATITTAATIDKPITKVAVTIDAISRTDRVNSIKLYTSADYATWTEAGTFTKSTGAQTVTISSPAANHFYRIVVDCASGTQDNVHISKVEYYKADESNTVATPVISGTQKFNPSTTIEIECDTEGAAIQYSLDGGTTWLDYSNTFTIYATTTVKAKATKDGMTDSPEASKSFSHANDVVDCTWNLKAAPTGSSSAAIATWTNDAEGKPTGAVMSMAKGGSSNNVTAHLGQSDGTYLYNNHILMITPIEGYAIVSVEITVSGSTDGLTGNAWSNATASVSGTKVTVTPSDGTVPVSVVCAAGTETDWLNNITEHYTTITGVKVEYSPTTSPYIAVTNDVVNATSEGASGVIEVFYNDVKANNAVVVVIDEDGNEVTWITASLNDDDNIAYSIAANTTLEARTAYIVVSVGDVHSNAVTVTQEKPYTVKVGKIGYTTYVAPADVAFPEGATAFIVFEQNGSSVKLSERTSVPAGTAVILKSEDAMSSDNGIEYVLSITKNPEDVTDNLLKACTEAFNPSAANTIYCLANKSRGVGFYPVATTVTIPVGKAYLEIASVEAKAFYGFFEDEATSIQTIDNGLQTTDSAIYNVAGQRLQMMQKGINIVNGKKVMVK